MFLIGRTGGISVGDDTVSQDVEIRTEMSLRNGFGLASRLPRLSRGRKEGQLSWGGLVIAILFEYFEYGLGAPRAQLPLRHLLDCGQRLGSRFERAQQLGIVGSDACLLNFERTFVEWLGTAPRLPL